MHLNCPKGQMHVIYLFMALRKLVWNLREIANKLKENLNKDDIMASNVFDILIALRGSLTA